LTRAGKLPPENRFGVSSLDPPLQWFGSLAQQDWPLVGEISELEDSEEFREKAPAEIKPSDGQLVSLDELPGNDVITYRKTVRESPEGTPQYYSAQKIQRRYVADTSDGIACTLVTGQTLSTGLGPYMARPRSRPNVNNTSSPAYPATRILRRLWEKYRNYILIAKVRTQGSMLSLSHKDVHRLSLAGTFVNEQIQSKLKPESGSTAVPFDPFNDRRFNVYGERLLNVREQNWTGILDLLDSFDYFGGLGVFLIAFLLAIVFVFLPGAYGGVHYAVIGIGFPSAIERLLWEISCFFLLGFAALIPAYLALFLGVSAIAVVLVVPLLLVELANFFIKKASGVDPYEIISKKAARVWKSLSEPEKKRKEPTVGEEIDKDPAAKKIWAVFLSKEYKPKTPAGKAAYWLGVTILSVIRLLIYTLIVGVVLAYYAARIFIVVEVFLSLRSVSIGVYQTPHINFMNYIPHF
jgi:hypothetical protein